MLVVWWFCSEIMIFVLKRLISTNVFIILLSTVYRYNFKVTDRLKTYI